MSPASKSKSKDKKPSKETAKASSKPSGHANSNGGIPASGYNPLSGTFHTFDSDDHNGNSSNTITEDDSISNNGSWSCESDDQKEKTSQPSVSRHESVPGADNDKREKIRQKNERKHQRQKERRAQELHERCSGYLMSRKLESLSQQLVVMGFSQEKATMSLIMNEGRVEESVAWLFEGNEEDKSFEHNDIPSLKIDISDELAQITEMEVKYKASRQEVERAVVFCEGNLERAEELLKAQKLTPKPEETSQITAMRVQVPSDTIELKRDEREFNYTKVPLKKIPPKPQQVDKRWPSSLGSNNPSVSCSAAPPPHMAVGNELKNLQLGSVREPVTVMQRPQSGNVKQAPVSSMGGWYHNNSVDTTKGSGPRSLSSNGVSSSPLYEQLHYHNQIGPGSGRGGVSPTLSAASSLGLFSGLGGKGSSSSVDWNTGGSNVHTDYTSIDWSLDLGAVQSRPGGLWGGPRRGYDSFGYGLGLRPVVSANGNGGLMSEGVVGSGGGDAGGSWEWSSPFEEKDLFSLSRQFVSSPSL